MTKICTNAQNVNLSHTAELPRASLIHNHPVTAEIFPSPLLSLSPLVLIPLLFLFPSSLLHLCFLS